MRFDTTFHGGHGQPGLPPDNPTDSPNNFNVTTGPNGSTTIVNRDSIEGVPPSQQGLPETERGHESVVASLVTGDPRLPPPGPGGTNFGQNLLTSFMSLFEPSTNTGQSSSNSNKSTGNDDDNDDGSMTLYSTHGRHRSNNTSSNNLRGFTTQNNDNTNNTQNNKGTDRGTQVAGSGQAPEPPGTEQVPGPTGSEPPPEPTGLELDSPQVVSDKIHNSTDETEIFNQLKSLVDYTTDSSLTDEQKTLIESKLQQLAHILAERNANGDFTDLDYSDPAKLLASMEQLLNLQDDTTISADNKTLVRAYLLALSEDMGAINAAAGLIPPEDPQYTSMNSSDIAKIYNTLLEFTAIDTDPRFAKLSDAEKKNLKDSLYAIATSIAAKNQTGQPWGIESVSDRTLLTLLLKQANILSEGQTLDDLEDIVSGWGGSLSDILNSTGELSDNGHLLETLLISSFATISTKLSQINLEKARQDTFSTDKAVVEEALIRLTNVRYDESLTPAERQQITDYLKLMSLAMALMSELRAYIAIRDSQFSKTEAQAKLASLDEQSKLALETYNKKLEDIKEATDKQLKQIEQQKLMKWLMPLITAIMAIISIIVTVVTLGAGSVLGAVLIAATIALTVLSIVDQTTSCIKNALMEAGLSEGEQAGVMFAIQMAILAILTVITCGAAGPLLAGQASMKAVAEGFKIAAQEFTKSLFTNIATTGSMVMGSLMSSGCITQACIQTYKLANPNASDKDASTYALIMTIILMVLMIAFCVAAGKMDASAAAKAGAKGAGEAVDNATGVGDDIVQNLDDTAGSADNVPGGLGSSGATGNAFVSAGQDASKISGRIATMMQRIADEMRRSFAGTPDVLMFILKLISGALNAAASATSAKFNLEMADLSTQQAQLLRELGDLEAILNYLKEQLPLFDVNIDGLKEDANSMLEFVNSLFQLFAQMTSDASAITNRMAQSA